MSNFNNKTITSKGLELLSSALAGNTLEFTRIVMGSGTYEGDIGLIESLVNQKQSLDIKSITRKGSQVVLSTTLLQNAIIEDFYWKEIGIYAKVSGGLEVLYMYGSASEASYISKNMLNEKMINVGVLVSNAQNVTATIDESLLYVSSKDLSNHNNDAEAHSALKTWVQGLFNSLKLTWDNITGKPNTFPPPVASSTVLGGVKQGSNITIAADGTISGTAQYTHPNTHPASMITGLPTSLPASDVYAWAKQSTKPTYNASEVGALPNPGYGGVHELGQFLDFHVAGSTADFNGRIFYESANGYLYFVDAGGILPLTYEINNLKSTVVSGKQSVANAINGKLGTSLSNQTSFADMAYYINAMNTFKSINYVTFVKALPELIKFGMTPDLSNYSLSGNASHTPTYSGVAILPDTITVSGGIFTKHDRVFLENGYGNIYTFSGSTFTNTSSYASKGYVYSYESFYSLVGIRI